MKNNRFFLHLGSTCWNKFLSAKLLQGNVYAAAWCGSFPPVCDILILSTSLRKQQALSPLIWCKFGYVVQTGSAESCHKAMRDELLPKRHLHHILSRSDEVRWKRPHVKRKMKRFGHYLFWHCVHELFPFWGGLCPNRCDRFICHFGISFSRPRGCGSGC